MSYINDLLNGTLEPKPDQIALVCYVQASNFIARYLVRVFKDKALAIYDVPFHLS
ncbi:hypothetical protein [Sulfurovum sp.]|uniref:hypothetical protein n=1 Tax=Sulfurovum sp. TaxID=1969726 RepID=UPI00356812DF